MKPLASSAAEVTTAPKVVTEVWDSEKNKISM